MKAFVKIKTSNERLFDVFSLDFSVAYFSL